MVKTPMRFLPNKIRKHYPQRIQGRVYTNIVNLTKFSPTDVKY